MAHFEAKYHTFTVEEDKKRFLISDAFKQKLLVPSQKYKNFWNILENPKLKLMNGFPITAIPP